MKRLPTWLIRLLQLTLLVLVCWGIYRRIAPELGKVDAEDFLRYRPSPGLLITSTVLLLCMYLAHAFLWRRIVSDIVGQLPARAATIRVYFVSSLGRYLPGKVWQVAGLALLSQRAGLPPVGATAAALIGQLGFLTTGVLFFVVLLPRWAGAAAAAAAALTSVLLLALTVYVLARTHVGTRIRAWAGVRFGSRITSALELSDNIRPGHAVLWTLGYAATWLLLALAFGLFVVAFVPGAARYPRELAGAVAGSYLAGYLAVFTVAGVGVREGVMALLLNQVVPAPAAIVIAVASRIWFTAAELLPLAALPLLREEPRPAERTQDMS